MKTLNVLRAVDQKFWAYWWIFKEHSLYTNHHIIGQKHNEVNLDGIDVIYIHSPDITNYHAQTLPIEAKNRGIKVIGAYAGNPNFWSPAEKRTYSFADIIVAISPQTYSFCKFHYTNIPTIYMPECVDTNFFTPKVFNPYSFVVGWAGGAHKPIKRFHLTKELDFPIITKDNWKHQRNSQNSVLTLEEMRDFYRSIDVLVITSKSECQSRVAMEAMATGLPVITTNVGSMKMLLQPEMIVPVDDECCVKQMNKLLHCLHKNPTLQKEIGDRNRIYIDSLFSWKNNMELWDNLFINVYNNNIQQAVVDSEVFLSQFGDKFTSELENIA
jgi:glycosyltransferase involved in cell wall biosynthesis